MKYTIFTSTLIAFFIFLIPKSFAYAATLSLDPASNSIPVNSTFDVKVLIDTQGEDTRGADVILKFNSSILSVVSIVEGTNGSNPFYPDLYQTVSPGEIYIAASVVETIDTRSGSGTIATISFKGISQGTSDVTFDCTPGKTSDTNISKDDKNNTDIVTCSALTNGRYTIGSGVTTPAPTQAYAPPVYKTPTPTIPRSGTAEITFGIAGLGMLLLLAGIGSKMILRS
jgi:hypothetical protein